MKSLEERAKQAQQIIANPTAYKVCEGCGSIVRTHTIICPVCKSYRFDADPNRVIEQARILGSREQHTVTEDDL